MRCSAPPPTQVTARFEERGLFAVAPTTILGMATRYSLGERGAINLIGLYQREQSAFTRPALGFEASANLIGGVNTELHFKPGWVNSFLNKLVTKEASAPSLFDVNAELALHQARPEPLGAGLPGGVRGRGRRRREPAGDPVGVRQPAPAGHGTRRHRVRRRLRPRRRGGAHVAESGPGPRRQRPGAPPAGHRHADPAGGARRGRRRPSCISTLHADTAGGIVQQNNSSRWSLPRRDFSPALALDGHLAEPHRARPQQRRLPGVLAVSAGGRSGQRGRPAGWCSTWARSARTPWRSRPTSFTRERRGHRLHRSAAGGRWDGSTPSAPTSASSTPRPTTSAFSGIDRTASRKRGWAPSSSCRCAAAP